MALGVNECLVMHDSTSNSALPYALVKCYDTSDADYTYVIARFASNYAANDTKAALAGNTH